MVDEFVSGREVLFAGRIKEGCIVDGHADLLADDIFLVDGEPALLDCLEFEDELRYLDRIDDAAFLAMDLEFLGRKDLGDYFLAGYAVRSVIPPRRRCATSTLLIARWCARKSSACDSPRANRRPLRTPCAT